MITNLNFGKNNHIHSFVLGFTAITIFSVVFFSFASAPIFVKASSSNGVIDSVNKYAKGKDQKDVRINFGFFRGTNGIVVTDSSLSGYAWGENIGWVNLFPGGGGILNNGEGVLSGYAASEFGGWINFNGVTINSSGDFLGYATTEKLGRIIFNCSTDNSCATDNFKVSTDWRPASIRKNEPPAPTYTAPVVTAPPVFTPTGTPTKEDTTTTKGGTTTTTKPLPVTDTGQYESGGDVVKNNGTVVEGGQVTTIRLPSGDKVDTNPVPVVEKKDTVNTNTSTSKSITKTAKDVTEFVQTTSSNIAKEAVIITDTPTVSISTKTVTTVGVAGGGGALISSVGGLTSFSEFFLAFFRIWSLFLSALGLKKKKEPWGTVYDSITKQPLDPAYVILEDKDGKEVATSITDLDGRFGFLVPPGVYRMIAKKTNYIAPSLHLHGKERDELYDNLYFGEDIEIGTSKTITRNIPMDQQGFDWNEFAKRDKNIMKFTPHKKLLAQISSALFFVGLFFSVGLFIIKPDAYNIAILCLYAFLSIVRFKKEKTKSFGTIKDKLSGFPLSFAIIRIYLKSTGREMFHRVTDEYGRYYCLLSNGDYYVTIEKKNINESYTKVYTTDIVSVRKGIIDKDFLV